MKKIFRKKNIKYYLIFYLIIEVITGFSIIGGIFAFGYNLFEITFNASSFASFIKAIIMLIIMILLWVGSFVVITMPITIILLASKTVDFVQESQNRKYTSKENIIYYREKFKEASPATMSLMQNLRIEEEKDITAILLKLILNKNISIDANGIKILSDNVNNLLPEEQRVFYMITENNCIKREQIEKWKEFSIMEAISKGYIKKQDPKKGLLFKKVILICIMLIFFMGFSNTNFKELMVQLENEINHANFNEDTSIIEFVEDNRNDKLLNITFNLIVGGICLFGMIAWPIFYIVFTLKYQNKNNSLKRTEKGEKLANEIQGMKNYVHDFSLLNNAEKEELILWDDFLVYAVVLGENKQIVDEILSSKGINYFDAKLIIQK